MDATEAGEEVDDRTVLNEKLTAVGDHIDRIGWTCDAMTREQGGTLVRLEGEVAELLFCIEAVQVPHNNIAQIADAVEDHGDRCVGGHLRQSV